MFRIPKLPYEMNALEPVLSEHQIDLHYNKHHQGYVDKLNSLIANTKFLMYDDIESMVKYCTGEIYNNAAQYYNHCIYWKSMKSPEIIKPASATFTQAINDCFGSAGVLVNSWIEMSMKHFGSGWTWLCYNKAEDTIHLRTTHDADNPLKIREIPLLTCDLWEHSYAYFYENRKEEYVRGFINRLANWQYASERYEIARLT